MLASRQSEVCERNTRVDVRAGCAHCGSERVPGGATRHPYEHGVERAHSHRLIAIADPHRLRLVTCKANRRSQTAVRQGTIAVGAPVQLCTVTGVHKLDHGARRGQSRRQRSHQTEENEKSHSPELCKSAWRRPQGVRAPGDCARFCYPSAAAKWF